MWRRAFLLFGLSFVCFDQASAQQLVDLNLATTGPRGYDSVTAPMDPAPAQNFELGRPTFLMLTYTIEKVPAGSPKGGYQMFPVMPERGADWEPNYTFGRTLSVKSVPAEEIAGQPFRREIVMLAWATPPGIAIRCKLVPHHHWQAFQIGNRGTQVASTQTLTVEGAPFDEYSSRDNALPKWDITGDWGHGDPSIGLTATWTFTPKGNGEYDAVQKGFDNAKGTARVRGDRIYIDYTSTTAKDGKQYKGLMIIDLSPKGVADTGIWATEKEIGDTRVWTSKPARPIGSGSIPDESKMNGGSMSPVDISGTWTHGTAGETWTFTPIAPGEYIAVEKGFGNAKGKATVKGNKIHIDYTTSTGKKGTYDVTINPDNKSGKGIWSEQAGASGSRDFIKETRGTPSSTQPITTPSTPSSGLTVQAGVGAGNEGQSVDIPISIFKPSSISNLNVVIEYDPSIAKVNTKPKAADALSNYLFEANSSELGTVRIGFAGSKGLNQEGAIASIPFSLIGKAGSSTPLKVTVTSANAEGDELLKAATIDGQLTVLGSKPDDKPPVVPGDINGDDQVNALDALQALKMSVKLLAENPKADVDTDGAVTSNDARLILKKVVGAR
jgi:Cohesin domain/Dockerin type I domain